MGKTIQFFLLIIFGVLGVSSCTKSETHLEIVEDKTIQQGLLDFAFDYELYIPGNTLSYNYLWTGYDTENKFGINISKENRFYTYLLEYYAAEKEYYLIYIKQNLIQSNLKDWVSGYENNNQGDIANYHFSNYDEERIIDGKYVFAYQNYSYKEDNLIQCYKTDSIENIPFYKEEYQLAFCCQRKQINIKENISLKKSIHKNLYLYARVEIQNSGNRNLFYTFETAEKNNQIQIKKSFDYVGQKIESYPQDLEELEYSSFPVIGLKNCKPLSTTISAKVLNENQTTYVILPRYIRGTSNMDLLDENSDFTIEEDVFRNFKKDFLSAYYKAYRVDSDNYEYGLYDYTIIKEIIQ